MSIKPKFERPNFLPAVVTQAKYDYWLYRKALTHARRDRKRGNSTSKVAAYKLAIHTAVCRSEGRDAYTGEELSWTLISKYDNESSKQQRRAYKAQFALLPTVDHVGDGLGPADFRICAWRTNDAKSDLPYDEFLGLCQRVVAHLSKEDKHVPQTS
jgi:hypothetical protein